MQGMSVVDPLPKVKNMDYAFELLIISTQINKKAQEQSDRVSCFSYPDGPPGWILPFYYYLLGACHMANTGCFDEGSNDFNLTSEPREQSINNSWNLWRVCTSVEQTNIFKT